MQNGEARALEGIGIMALPAYNLVHKRENGEPSTARARATATLSTFNKTRVYIAGDTENIPEMAELKDIDYAFLPMNLPYTMTPEWWPRQSGPSSPRWFIPTISEIRTRGGS